MNKALSHIMWGDQVDEGPFLELAASLGFTGLEIAPSLVNPDPWALTEGEMIRRNKAWAAAGLAAVSFHALFYGLTEPQLFGTEPGRRAYLDFLAHLARLAGAVGCPIMVIGSPANRGRGGLDKPTALAAAVDLLGRAAVEADRSGVCLCIEPLPERESDFINDHAEALALVRAVDHPALGMILDAKALVEQGEDGPAAITASAPYLRHFHVNDPGLTPPGTTGRIDHALLGRSLRAAGYDDWVSLEVGRSQGRPRKNIIQGSTVLDDCYLTEGNDGG